MPTKTANINQLAADDNDEYIRWLRVGQTEADITYYKKTRTWKVEWPEWDEDKEDWVDGVTLEGDKAIVWMKAHAPSLYTIDVHAG